MTLQYLILPTKQSVYCGWTTLSNTALQSLHLIGFTGWPLDCPVQVFKFACQGKTSVKVQLCVSEWLDHNQLEAYVQKKQDVLVSETKMKWGFCSASFPLDADLVRTAHV